MAALRKANTSNGKTAGFDNEADFIPFDFSDNEDDRSRPESRQSLESLLPQPLNNLRETTSETKKRKRKEVESSPERGPPRQRQRYDINPWQTDVDDYASLKETARMLHQEVQDFTNWISPTTKEAELRTYVVRQVVQCIEREFPSCRAYPFGSFSTKLYHPDADIDLVVDWPGHTWTKSTMRKLGHHIGRSGHGRNFQYIFGAKVPIIKFVDTYAGIDIDISFNQINGLEVIKIVQGYMRDMPAVRPLVMVLKSLFKQHSLSIPAEGGLGSYSIICMVISFLQRHPKVAAGHVRAEENLGAMLIEILELYGNRFNFDRVGIAIDNGGSYFDKFDYMSQNMNIWKKICVQDPNDPTNNIAKASHQIDRIIKAFGDAFRDLTRRCYLIHANIEKGEKAPWGTTSGSILDAIIQPPHSAIRERLKRAWKEHMSENHPQSPIPPTILPPNAHEPRLSSPKPKKAKNRAARRAEQAAQKLAARIAKKQVNEEKEISGESRAALDLPLPPSPSKKKNQTAPASSGTKDTPIILEDSPASSPQVQPRQRALSPTKKQNGAAPVKTGIVAAANMQASGSINGLSRNIITID